MTHVLLTARSLDALFILLTQRIQAEVRLQALTAVAQASTILHQRWVLKNCDGCIFAVLWKGATGKTMNLISVDSKRIGQVLGITQAEVRAGYQLWDRVTQAERDAFVEQIRAHVRRLNRASEPLPQAA